MHEAAFNYKRSSGADGCCHSSHGSDAPDALEDIRVRAETVSNLLKEIMDHGVTRHSGIND